MTLMLALTITLATLSSFILTSTPATASIWLIVSSLFLAISLSPSSSPWFAFALFLIYVGGMLVMFSYFVIIQPNQQLRLQPPLLSTLVLSVLILMLMPPTLLNTPPHLPNLFPPTLLLPKTLPTLMLLALILFLALIAVVKITSPHKGPIRPFL